jgi:hypothetical protein
MEPAVKAVAVPAQHNLVEDPAGHQTVEPGEPAVDWELAAPVAQAQPQVAAVAAEVTTVEVAVEPTWIPAVPTVAVAVVDPHTTTQRSQHRSCTPLVIAQALAWQ